MLIGETIFTLVPERTSHMHLIVSKDIKIEKSRFWNNISPYTPTISIMDLILA
jgi:hypothetical protein